MLRPIRAAMSAGCDFMTGWREAAMAGYRRQYGLFLALPLAWGCLDAYLLPYAAAAGFLASAWFLEGRPGKRLAWQSLLFAVWALFLGDRLPDRSSVSPFPAAYARAEKAFEMEGTVAGFPTRKRKAVFCLAAHGKSYRVQTEAPAFPILPGQKLRGRFRKAPPAPATNPGQFEYAAYLRSQDLAGSLEAESLSVIGPPGAFDRLILSLRDALERILARSIPEAQLPLMRAALLGVTDDLDPGLVDDFKASGMLHILAISGQHVGIFALILLQLSALLHLPRKAAFLATGAVIALYVPICGNQISVLRAAIMFWSCLPAVLWERPASAINNLGWAAAASLTCMPYQILSLGFQLSFAASFLLILYSRPMASLLQRFRIGNALAVYCVSTPALSLVIYLGIYPLLAALIHAAAPSSILGNLATVGLSSGMLVSSCLAVLTAPVHALAACFGESAGAMGALLTASVHGLAHWPGAALSVPALPMAWGLGLLFLVLAFPHALRTGRGLPFFLLGSLAFSARWCGAEARMAWFRPASIAYLDVGQGDGAVLRFPGAVVLMDAGPPDAGRNVILPYLRCQGIDRLDLAVVTHPDLDHYGGLAYVAGHIAIGKVIYSGEDADTHAWKELKACLAARGVPMVKAARGMGLYSWKGGAKGDAEASLAVLSPERTGQFPDRNDNSVVTLAQLHGKRFLFTGDMGTLPEAHLLELGTAGIRGAVLKVPHHGSDLSNTAAFLEAVDPPVAVLSAGRLNRFGHPGKATVGELKHLDARLYLTARDGTVTYACDRRSETWSTYFSAGPAGPVDVWKFAGRENNLKPGRHARSPARGP